MYRKLIAKYSIAVLFLFLLASAAAAYFLPGLGIEASLDLLLNEDDPDLAYYNITRPDWSYDEYVMVCVQRDEWFTPEALGLLGQFVRQLEKLPHIQKDGVLSILKVPLLRNQAPVFGLPMPLTLTNPKVNLEKARGELLEHNQARGNLISADGKSLLLLAYLDVPQELRVLEPQWSRALGERNKARLEGNAGALIEAQSRLDSLRPGYDRSLSELKARRRTMVGALRRLVGEWSTKFGPDQSIRLSGTPIITINLQEHIEDDVMTFGIASFAFFVLGFAIVYRRMRWTALPILTSFLPVLLVAGAMGLLNMRVTVISSNFALLLFVLMLPYTVYFVERYRERRAREATESQLDATVEAARQIWSPCLYSCLTTMAGFASLITSGIPPVRAFGIAMSVGMGVGLVCVFVFLPSISRPLRPIEVRSAGPAIPARGIVRLLERWVLESPTIIVAGSAGLLALGIWGTTRIHVETKFIDYFRSGGEVYRGLEYIDTRMGGTTPLEIMLTSTRPGHFKTAEGLDAIAAASKYFDSVPEAANVRSFKTLVDEVRKAFMDKEGKVRVKDEQILKLVTSAAKEQVREFSNDDLTTTRILVRFRETAPSLHRKRILDGLRRHLAEQPQLQGLDVKPTGIFLIYSNMLQSLIKSQRETFLMVLGAIFLMLLMLFRSVVLAAVVLIPQVLPVFICLGTMGWTGIPLDLVTVMIASIAMGVGIDAAIQYTVRYRAELLSAGGDRRAAISRSHGTIGRAIWIATSIIVGGFLVLSFSRFIPSVYLGLFTALAMLMGQFAALTLLPALFLILGLPRLEVVRQTQTTDA